MELNHKKNNQMEARTKTGKLIHGKIADILVKKGVATEVKEEEPKKVTKKKVTKKAKK